MSQSVHLCHDTVLIVDVGDTTSASGSTLSATVQRTTELGTITSNEAVVGYLQSPLQHIPVLTSSVAQVSPVTSDVFIEGSYFGVLANNIRVYLSSSSGAPALADVSLIDSSHIKVKFRNDTSMSGTIMATASVKGVLSNTATIALQGDTLCRSLLHVLTESLSHPFAGQKPTLQARFRQLESPVEGTRIAIYGSNLLLSDGAVCVWSALQNTTGVIAGVHSPTFHFLTHLQSLLTLPVVGNGSAVFCPTPMANANVTTILSVRLGAETVQTGVSVRFFTTMLVSDIQSNSVLRFNAETGELWDTFVNSNAGGLDGPWGSAFGPTKTFHVASANSGTVLMYHGSTGKFIRKFCDVPSPRGLTFHYGELYVCSSDTATIFRFNSLTGAPRGILSTSPLLQHTWSILFDRTTNKSLVAGQYQQRIIQIDPPRVHTNSSTNYGFNASRAHLWSSHKIHHITGLDFSSDHVYAISPYTGGVMQFNRTNGLFINHFEGFMSEAFDVKVYNSSVYSCGAGGIERHVDFPPVHLLDHDAGFHKNQAGVRCSFLLINSDFGALKGK